MESGSSLVGGTRQISDLKPEPAPPKRQKSEAKLRSDDDFGPMMIFDRNLKESELSVYDDDDEPFLYVCDEFVYKNKARRKIEEEDARYKELSRKLSPYDAIAPPKNSQLLGGSPVVPIAITGRDRPVLIQLSQLALEDYNDKNQGASFVFGDLVRCTVESGYDYDVSKLYITFQAKATEDPSNTKTFQAHVWKYSDDNIPSIVKECRITN
jgi:hypothetical protein